MNGRRKLQNKSLEKASNLLLICSLSLLGNIMQLQYLGSAWTCVLLMNLTGHSSTPHPEMKIWKYTCQRLYEVININTSTLQKNIQEQFAARDNDSYSYLHLYCPSTTFSLPDFIAGIFLKIIFSFTETSSLLWLLRNHGASGGLMAHTQQSCPSLAFAYPTS